MATSQDFVNWVCGPELEPEFLMYLLTTARRYIRGLASGATHQTVYMPTIQAFHVCVPPRPEQQRIAGILKEQMAAVERARVAAEQQLGAAEALRMACLRQVFDDRIRSTWRETVLGECGEIVSGITLGRRLAPHVEVSPVPYLRVANVKDGFLDMADIATVDATPAEVQRLKLEVGDLLLTEGGDPDKLGRGTVWQGELALCTHQNHVFRVRPDCGRFSPEFLSLLLGSPYGKDYFSAHAKQTTGIATINQRVLRAFPVRAPSLDEQQAIAATTGRQLIRADALRSVLSDQLEVIDALPEALLRKAFSGEL